MSPRSKSKLKKNFNININPITLTKRFFPYQEKGVVLKKTTQGNWSNATYKLIAWKGYVVQQNGKAIFGGQ